LENFMTKKQTFEEAISRLEDLVSKLEGGNVPLEEMLTLYEEGAQLIKYCLNKLEHAENKIKKLSGAEESDFKLEPDGQ
jgi:exodeoxyribonuclease VII small subunit